MPSTLAPRPVRIGKSEPVFLPDLAIRQEQAFESARAASSRQEQVWETAGATFLINFACTKAGFMIEDMKYENSWKGT